MNAGGGDQRGDVVWNRVLDGGVAGARDIAAEKHIPKREMMPQDEGRLLLVCGRSGLTQREGERRPEAVLRVRVIKRPLARFRRGYRAENQDFALA